MGESNTSNAVSFINKSVNTTSPKRKKRKITFSFMKAKLYICIYNNYI